jgi:hypothetical protein
LSQGPLEIGQRDRPRGIEPCPLQHAGHHGLLLRRYFRAFENAVLVGVQPAEHLDATTTTTAAKAETAACSASPTTPFALLVALPRTEILRGGDRGA